VHESIRQTDTLAITFGQGADEPAAHFANAAAFQAIFDPLGPLLAADAFQLGR